MRTGMKSQSARKKIGFAIKGTCFLPVPSFYFEAILQAEPNSCSQPGGNRHPAPEGPPPRPAPEKSGHQGAAVPLSKFSLSEEAATLNQEQKEQIFLPFNHPQFTLVVLKVVFSSKDN